MLNQSIQDELDTLHTQLKSLLALSDLLSSLHDALLRDETLPYIGLLLIWVIENSLDCLSKIQSMTLPDEESI